MSWSAPACLIRRTARRHVPSQTTMGGLVKHLSEVENGSRWCWPGVRRTRRAHHRRMAAGRWAATYTAESRLARYERACEASRRIASGFSLDDCVPHPRLGQVSLRWIYVHMIEESARHVGHADILREQTDGATGFDG